MVGTGTASWFSPCSQGSVAPFADVVATRLLSPNIRRLDTAWLSRLFSPRIAVRRVGNPEWYVAIGDLCSVIAKAWLLSATNGVYSPEVVIGPKSATFTCTGLADFEAMPLHVASPMRRAYLREQNTTGFFTGSLVRLKASAEYGSLPIAAFSLDPARPLLETACRGGFWNLPASFLHKLCLYLGAEMKGTKLFDLLLSLIRVCIPAEKVTDDLIQEILNIRSAEFEFDEDLEQLCDMEYVLDCFDAGERTSLQLEIKSAKEKKQDKVEFDRDLCDWKVRALWHD